jgi:hypothetical protein
MATYKEIHGTNIEVVSSDPSNPVEGQVWYNSTTNVLKGEAQTATAAWSSGGALNTARYVLGGGGSQTAAIAFGGARTPGPTSQAVTELYDGTSWTEVNDLNTARERCSSAATTNTASLAMAGVVYPGASNSNLTENWNGTNWTEVNDLSLSEGGRFGFGTPSAAVMAGGGSPPNMNVTETWNGTNWSTSPATLNTGRKDNEGGASGTSTAGIITGGNNGSTYDVTELWNGSAWTEVNDLNTARSGLMLSGITTAAIAAGGTPNPTASATESWNGTNWTTTTSLPAQKRNGGASRTGGNTAALVFGGYYTAQQATTFEWNGAGAPQVRTFTDS